MPSDRIFMEGGMFDWGLGRGYQAPAESGLSDRPSFSPGRWNETPPEREYYEDQPSRQPSPEPRQVVATAMPGPDPLAEGPEQGYNLVHLDFGLATYMGHAINLSEAAVTKIKEVLAQEVVNSLRAEQERVLAGIPAAVVGGPPATAQGPEQVQDVRPQVPDSGVGPLQPLQSPEAIQAGSGGSS